MEKYLKMSGYFVGNVSINTDGQICDDKYFRGSTDIAEDYYEPICHAINSHDELVAMNKELLTALECAEGFVSEVSEKTGFGQVHTLKVIRSAIAKAKAAA